MELSHQDLDDLKMAVECWLNEYDGACPEEEYERVRMLLVRLKVRRLTTEERK